MENEDELVEGIKNTQFRKLDSRIGRWMSIDPLASSFPNQSPYSFSLNNPITQTDKTGAAPDDWIKNKKTGAYEWRDDVTSPDNTPEGYDYVGETGNYLAFNG